ncbi:hypothetical protein [Methanobrevibacter sp.]|uniref:hypothetical protein n=1 Tax=Methanobrevibacter sp. TaxID=66852 RepID=UPI0038908379
MGQRLNVEIISRGRTIANVYMHWSAYTSSSLDITKDFITVFSDIKSEDLENLSEIYRRIKIAALGSSVTLDEVNRLKDTHPEITAMDKIDRNDGLISFTEKGIEYTRNWEEGRVSIDIENKTVDFRVYYDDTDEDDEYTVKKFKTAPTIESKLFSVNPISYCDFCEEYNKIGKMIDDAIYKIIVDGRKILFIE